jgi:2-oxoglutarate dehydrogenase E1 component
MSSDESLESQIANLSFLEEIYQQYQSHPQKVDPSWISFFQKIEEQPPLPTLSSKRMAAQTERAEHIAHLADAYRRHGHLLAVINPIALEKPKMPEQLKLENLGFQSHELEEIFPTLGLLSQPQAPLKEIIALLNKRYSQSVGFEFKGFTNPELENWIQQHIESGKFDQPLNLEEKLIILDILTRAEVLETFLHTKHVGKKRFSLEGAESLIPMLSFMIAQAAEEEVEEIFIGMSHRGRLNVLANILNKPMTSILKDFDEDYVPAPSEGMGDIRYHKGYANESINTYRGKSIKLTMAPNPSHLESVNPVIEGQTHAKQFLVNDEKKRMRIVPLLMHGDAALAGQGVVYETLQMSKLPGFETGGTLHIAINNQIGFTASAKEERSTLYCTDIARTFGAPIFHVNAEDVEMCVRMALFAFAIRQEFHCDVFIDLNCYRKYGHNEGDEPAFTQPLEYQMIRKKRSIRNLYLDQLIREGHIDKKVADNREEILRQHLQEAYQLSQEKGQESQGQSQFVEESFSFPSVDTRVELALLQEVAERFSQIPADFHLNSKLKNLVKERSQAIFEDKPFDWGMAEFLAYGTLVWEGIPVRLVGQDSGRGTFSHRHALWIDQENNQPYYPLAHVRQGQARFEVLNTCLSEVAALGFEYGYSTVCTEGLNIWEAQFGDFVNSAQVMIDQYIASGEQKWGQTSNLVLFLPHGFEGQGPEHSSARIERFLSLAGHDNIQIVNPTTPAQLFHLLRRQVKQSLQKPLVVFTPKGLLRHPASTSTIKDLMQGQFSLILDDPRQPKNIRRLILCSGRIYYDLDAQREKEKRSDVAIIRLEQLYPLNANELKEVIARYGSFQDCLWVQEEPENMGAWHFIAFYLPQVLPSGIPFFYVGRERSATPATGFYARHRQELANILHRVFHP